MPEPITQAPNTEANTTNSNSNPNVEARIAEITAKHAEEKRAMEAQFNELKLKYENTANAVAASLGIPGQPQQGPNIDPALLEVIKRSVQEAVQPLTAGLQQTRMSEQQRQLQESFGEYGAPDAVRKRAEELREQYAKAGQVINPALLRRVAWGEYAEAEAKKARETTVQRQGFNLPYANMGNGASLQLNSPLNGKEKPANFDSLSAGQQAAWYEKNLGNVPLT